MTEIDTLIVALVCGLASWWLTGRVRTLLLRHRLLDHPNERSSHTDATPRGGGLGIIAVALPAWLIVAYLRPAQTETGEIAQWLLPAGALILTVVSFIDDMRGLSQIVRLLAQTMVAITAVQFLPGPVFQGLLPPLADSALAVVAWLWFINLFNFMDGIDGISGAEAIGLGIGVYVIGLIYLSDASSSGQGAVIAAAMAGFLVWNWHPARIFLGDSGSIPLGFLLGWLLLELAAQGFWHSAVILPLYYWADATLTLVRRLLRGEAVWRAHREHFYQIAVQRGRSHSEVARAVAAANAVLVVLAVIAALPQGAAVLPWLMIATAGLIVALLMVWMAAGNPQGAPKSD